MSRQLKIFGNYGTGTKLRPRFTISKSPETRDPIPKARSLAQRQVMRRVVRIRAGDILPVPVGEDDVAAQLRVREDGRGAGRNGRVALAAVVADGQHVGADRVRP